MSSLREIAADTWQSPAMLLDRLGLPDDADIDRTLGPAEDTFYRHAVHVLDGLAT